ncbi:LysR family transcriptional regulator [Arsenicitalea aurantiaca]|nr:LysR family transcriptional regulator [Arsenicitalea aurantiaca]
MDQGHRTLADRTPEASARPAPSPQAERAAARLASEITLHQLRIFWTVANAESLTQAAKHLGLAQPSLSQQLARLESAVGLRLFERRPARMELTDVGQYLLPRAGAILRNMHELEDGLSGFRGGTRATIRISGITSVLRAILPAAMDRLRTRYEALHFDIFDNAPADILELLYARKINLGLVAANSVAESGVGFMQVPILTDPYLLAVPEGLALDGAESLAGLPPEIRETVNRSIQFSFGTQHATRVADWYSQRLPGHRVVARCRSFEMALEMVRAGLGVCLTPALSTLSNGRPLEGIRLYRVDVPPRRVVALIATQYRRLTPFSDLIESLEAIGAAYVPPEGLPMPPFLAERNGSR